MVRYVIKLKFDDNHTDVVISKKYFDAVEKYNAACSGNEKTGISRMTVLSKKSLNLEELAKDLEGIQVLSIHEVKDGKSKDLLEVLNKYSSKIKA